MKTPIDEYLENQPKQIQEILMSIVDVLRKELPEAKETLSYGIPTFDYDGKHVVHVAGFKKHIGFFPTPDAITAFQGQLSMYKTSKGTIQFPLDKPIPYELIQKITRFRYDTIKHNIKKSVQ